MLRVMSEIEETRESKYQAVLYVGSARSERGRYKLPEH